MKDIINVKNENGKLKVSGRMLHDVCKVDKDFAPWVKNQLENVGAEEDSYHIVWLDKNDDFFKEVVKEDNINSMVRNGYKQDYILDISIAKEICMVMGVAQELMQKLKE